MAGRITRLTTAEIVKVLSHPYFYFSVGVLIVLIPIWATLLPQFTGQEETDWRGFHALQLFAYGAKPGLKVATFLILIFTAMLFAGEFDRGTIKLLLTRPVTRTDFFAAKCITAGIFGATLVGVVLYVSLAFAFSRGELGPVWDDASYNVQFSYETIMDYAVRAVTVSLLPILAAAFLGLMISNLTDSAGYAVAGALIFYLLLDLVVGFLKPGTAEYFFLHYPGKAFDTLKMFSEGSSTRWPDWSHLRFTAPLATIAILGAAAYARFRHRDIKV